MTARHRELRGKQIAIRIVRRLENRQSKLPGMHRYSLGRMELPGGLPVAAGIRRTK